MEEVSYDFDVIGPSVKDPDTREEPQPTVSLSDLVSDNGETVSAESDDDSDD